MSGRTRRALYYLPMSEQTQVVRLLVVDDNRDLAELLAITLGGFPGIQLMGTRHSADDVLPALEQHPPDVVLIDLSMEGKPTLEAVREASARYPHIRFVIYSGYDDPETIAQAVDAGAWGFVSKHRGIEIVADAIRRVAAGELALEQV